MQARIVDAARGARWLGEGWRLFRAAPLGWIALVFMYMLITNLLALLPFVGVVAALMLTPPFSVGFMASARAVSRGARPEIGMLFDGFRHDLRAQIALGVVYVACGLVVFAATTLADEHGVLRSILAGQRPAEDSQVGDLAQPLAVLALLYLPVMMLFWFSPPLAAWHSTGAAKALFFSFFACVMNWRAFAAYGAVVAGVLFGVLFLLMSLVAHISGGLPAIAFVFPLLLVMLPTLFASFYASYRDVFGAAE
jgi:hypothetical protein